MQLPHISADYLVFLVVGLGILTIILWKTGLLLIGKKVTANGPPLCIDCAQKIREGIKSEQKVLESEISHMKLDIAYVRKQVCDMKNNQRLIGEDIAFVKGLLQQKRGKEGKRYYD